MAVTLRGSSTSRLTISEDQSLWLRSWAYQIWKITLILCIWGSCIKLSRWKRRLLPAGASKDKNRSRGRALLCPFFLPLPCIYCLLLAYPYQLVPLSYSSGVDILPLLMWMWYTCTRSLPSACVVLQVDILRRFRLTSTIYFRRPKSGLLTFFFMGVSSSWYRRISMSL